MDKPLTIDELRERYGVPLSTVYQWNRLGTGPRYMKIGKRVFYRIADVLAWEKSRLVREAQAELADATDAA